MNDETKRIYALIAQANAEECTKQLQHPAAVAMSSFTQLKLQARAAFWYQGARRALGIEVI